jgi:pimeloyl-ACP methyl ester carboxylesterase
MIPLHHPALESEDKISFGNRDRFMGRIPVKIADVDDVTLAYSDFGSGFPLIFINGFASTMDTWNPLVLSKISRHFRVIIFDNRGTGYSGLSGEQPFSLPLFAHDTATLMDQLGIPSAHILGHSMGACIAQELALRFPKKVNGLILVSGECRGPGSRPLRPEILAQLMDKSGTIQDLANRMFSILFPPSWLATHNPWDYCPEVYETTSDETIARQASAFLAWAGSFDRLGNIRSPALVVAGKDDVIIPPGNSRIISDRIPGAQYIEMDNAGHGLMYQFPDEFSAYVLEFLAGNF